jgi:hypothetical protein
MTAPACCSLRKKFALTKDASRQLQKRNFVTVWSSCTRAAADGIPRRTGTAEGVPNSHGRSHYGRGRRSCVMAQPDPLHLGIRVPRVRMQPHRHLQRAAIVCELVANVTPWANSQVARYREGKWRYSRYGLLCPRLRPRLGQEHSEFSAGSRKEGA